MGWSGAYGSTCNPGSTSLAYTEAIERRINFYRALAGVEGNVVVNTGSKVVIFGSDAYKPSTATTKTSAAQAAALMFSYANQITHTPPNAAPYSCWSSAAWNAANRSNLSIGSHGPEAVDNYIRENDPNSLVAWTDTVGHRRWILMQGATDFASGDVPGDGATRQPVNVLYVVPRNSEVAAVSPKFVGWPSSGFFPDALMAKNWSLSHPLADFSSATVVVTNAQGAVVATTIVDQATSGMGDPTIVWSVPNAVATPSVTQDTVYHVTVSGIEIGGQMVNHSYSITVFDPDVLTESLELTGTSTPPLTGANYMFQPIAEAEEHMVTATSTLPANWLEGAEDSSSARIVDQTDPGYALRTGTGFKRTGAKAFRLGFPTTAAAPQTFLIDREIHPLAGCQLNYYVRRGYMQVASKLDLQMSVDGNVWTTIDTLAGGASNSVDDSAFNLRSVPVSSVTPVRFRFRKSHGGGAVNTVSQHAWVGVFIDDITIVNAHETASSIEIPPLVGQGMIRLDSSTVGGLASQGQKLSLRLSASLGGRNYYTPNQLSVTFGGTISNFTGWIAAEHPQITNGFDGDFDRDGIANGIEYAFGLNPLSRSTLGSSLSKTAGGLQLRSPLGSMRPGIIYRLEVCDDLASWGSSGASVEWINGELVGSATIASDKAFARWRISEP